MIQVGAFEAKTHLSALIEKVIQGEEVLITRRGMPVARLVAAKRGEESDVGAAVDRLREIRSGVTLGDLDWRQLRDEGRR